MRKEGIYTLFETLSRMSTKILISFLNDTSKMEKHKQHLPLSRDYE
ncbi:hypothetical protein GGR15_004423 [Butyricimonas paravirosa]|uniref:Uncharacterized protein n=1 Tax=Butyricimonas paravirosa TaxID=1472417 RepID=A0A7X5YGM7_9BACT|nr:hypothetical protein [Butyricimonas paravirosa]